MTARKTSLRRAIWTGKTANPRDVAELGRDIDTALRSISVNQFRALRMEGWTYAPPIVFDNGGVTPLSILVGQVRIPGSPSTTVIATQPNWTIVGDKVSITSIGGLTVGARYDITLLIFG